MGETYDEVKAFRQQACNALKKMKEIEATKPMHTLRLNKNTIVCSSNKERLSEYKVK